MIESRTSFSEYDKQWKSAFLAVSRPEAFFFENPWIYHDMKGTGAIPIIGGTDFSDRIAQKSKKRLISGAYL